MQSLAGQVAGGGFWGEGSEDLRLVFEGCGSGQEGISGVSAVAVLCLMGGGGGGSSSAINVLEHCSRNCSEGRSGE